MHKYIKKIEIFFQQALKYISSQKKKLYKNHKSSLLLNLLRLAVCVFLVIMAIYAGIYFVVHAIALCALVLIIYFIVPTDFLEEAVAKKAEANKPAPKSVTKKPAAAKKAVKAKKPAVKKVSK